MAEQITRDMTFGELIKKFPKAAPILASYGLHCIGCHIATVETIEQGAMAHGLDDTQIGKMLLEMNQAVV